MDMTNSSATSIRFTWLSFIGLTLIILILLACIFAFFQSPTLHSAGLPGFLSSTVPSGSTGKNQCNCNVITTKPTALQQSIATAQATLIPTHQPKETVVVAFTAGGNAVRTQNSYSGSVNLTIIGEGQAAGQSFSDAFYIYTDQQNQLVTPHLQPNFATLCINTQPASILVKSLPTYNDAHTYTVTMNALDTFLTFGVCDDNTADNTGAFIITIA